MTYRSFFYFPKHNSNMAAQRCCVFCITWILNLIVLCFIFCRHVRSRSW